MHTSAPISRRHLLRTASMGFGSIALSSLLHEQAFAEKKSPLPMIISNYPNQLIWHLIALMMPKHLPSAQPTIRTP